jgi:hypothetical protein
MYEFVICATLTSAREYSTMNSTVRLLEDAGTESLNDIVDSSERLGATR